MGRYKLGPQGAYYDPNDSGPDQANSDQITQLQAQTVQAPNPSQVYTPPNGNTGINGGQIGGGSQVQPGFQIDPNVLAPFQTPEYRNWQPGQPAPPGYYTYFDVHSGSQRLSPNNSMHLDSMGGGNADHSILFNPNNPSAPGGSQWTGGVTGGLYGTLGSIGQQLAPMATAAQRAPSRGFGTLATLGSSLF
jgi:hypothetical protein